MNATDLLQRISESFGTTASARSVFGEPIQAGRRTVVPVAKIAYGFGGGAGGASAGRLGEGGGGGGGVRAVPAGALEITDDGTRFIPFVDIRLICVAFGAGIVLGRLMMVPRRGR